MKLSVIVPNYNGEKTIERCVRSIYSQKIRPTEIILVDDNSMDRSVEIVKNIYPKVKIIKNEKNRGAAYSRNVGIRNSRGDYILSVDSDVFLDRNCIEKMISYADYDLIYPTVVFENGKILSPTSEAEKIYLRKSPVFMIKRRSLEKLDELFDENYFVYYDDVDFFLRCYLFGLKAKYAEKAIAYHAIRGTKNLERRYYLETRNMIYALIKSSKVPARVKRRFAFPSLRGLAVLVAMPVINRNIFADAQINKKISDSRITILLLLLKALWWNVLHLKRSLNKERDFEEHVKCLTRL